MTRKKLSLALIFLGILSIAIISLYLLNNKLQKSTSSNTNFSLITDTTIKPSAKGLGYENTKNNFKTQFAPDPTELGAIKFESNTSTLSFHTPKSQQFGTLTPALPSVDKNTITYPNIFPDVNLRYSLSSERLLEEFIVSNKNTATKLTNISQQVELENIDNYLFADGSINFYQKDKLVLSLPKPVIYELNNKDVRSYGIVYDIVEHEKNKLTITKKLTSEGIEWLSSQERQYPVAIDLVIDNADTSGNWVSSSSTLLSVAGEATIKQEGTGSVKLSPTTSWYNFSWPYRIKLTIDATKVGGSNERFDDGHETGDLTAYNATAIDGGDLSVTANAALNGSSYGLQGVIDDTNGLQVREDVTKSTRSSARFYFDTNGLTMGNNNSFNIHRQIQNGGSYSTILIVKLAYTTVDGYKFCVEGYDDASTLVLNDCKNITDTPHYVEVQAVQATNSTSLDGSYTWWVDGVQEGTVASVDNYNRLFDYNWRSYLETTGVDAGTSGTVYWDDFVQNSDGTYIGPVITDFPVYVNLNDLPASFHSHVDENDANDIRVTKSDGVTELPRELVFYSAATDTGELHFKYTGTLNSTTNTDVYLYYGNAGASDYAVSNTYGRNNVWDDNFVGVWHLQESGNGTSGEYKDSTGNGFNGTGGSSAYPTQASAKIGNGQSFDGTNDIINVGDVSSVLNLISTTPPSYDIFAWLYKSDTAGGDLGGINMAGNTARVLYRTNTAISSQLVPGSTIVTQSSKTVGNWYYVAGSYNSTGTSIGLTVDTTISTPSTAADTNLTGETMNVMIGNAQNYYKGVIDEVRISNVVRTAAWNLTGYNNQNSSSTFYSEGTEETIVGQTATITTASTDLSSYDNLTYYVRSNRTGSFMRFQFGETTSSEQTNNITINSANTWEQKTWDISGIAAASRNAVTKYAFAVTDASATFDFYFDDINANVVVANQAPTTPTLNLPADTATGQSLTPALKTTTTDADSDYLRYKIELCTNALMITGCQTFDQTSSQTGWSGQDAQTSTAYASGTQATYTLQSSLSTGTTYYWRSYAIDPGGSNTWSSTQGTPYSFTTLNNAPTSPTSPYTEGSTNPTGIIDLTPEFSAIHNDPDSDPASYYEIEVNTASNFAGTVMWDTGAVSMANVASGARSTDVSYAGTALSYNGTTYYWRIRFTDNKGDVGAWSSTQTFSTNQKPSIPTLSSPADTATGRSITLSLLTTATDADSDYLRYKIELCTNVGMTAGCQTFDQTTSQTGWSDQNTQTSTAYTSSSQATYTLQTPLTNSTTYYWRSYAIDPGGTNTWSSTQTTPYSFTTTAVSSGQQYRMNSVFMQGIKF